MNQREQPLVSVIIPTYNRLRTLPVALESVLNQTYKRLEVLVIDDCSDDGTKDYIAGIKDTRVKYFRNNVNQGPSAARNRGVKLAEGEFIAFQDSDDEWVESKLEKQMQVMLNEEEPVELVYCEMSIYVQGSFYMIMPPKEVPYEEKKGDIFPYLLLYPLIGMGMLVKKQQFLQAGGFTESLKALEDFEFSVRFAKKYRVGFIQEALVKVNDSEKSVNKRYAENVRTQAYIIRETLDDLRKYDLLWEKVYIVKRYASAYKCYNIFLEEMNRASDQLIDKEEKDRLLQIITSTVEEDDKKIIEFRTEAYHQLLHMKQQIGKLYQNINEGKLIWTEKIWQALKDVQESLSDYVNLFDIPVELKEENKRMKEKLLINETEKGKQLILLVDLHNLLCAFEDCIS